MIRDGRLQVESKIGIRMSEALRVVVLGDSVTCGNLAGDVRAEQLYVYQLEEQFRQVGASIQLIPSALDGVDTRYALRRFDRMVAAHRPDVVCVMLGLNDVLPAGARAPITPQQYDQNLRLLIDQIRHLDAQPILATPTPRLSSDNAEAEAGLGDLMRDYVQTAMQVAETCSLRLIDAYSPFLKIDNLWRLIPDGIHPSAQGHEMIAQAFADLLIPLFNGCRPASAHA